MSVQFGKWNFDGTPALAGLLDRVSAVLAPYGPDGNSSYHKDGVSILYRAFHTTKESRQETQPHMSKSHAVVTWDGRLDNRSELIRRLGNLPSTDLSDVSIVAAAYETWGTDCFAKLIGDWALSVWNPKERSLVLAKDPIGTRHLYYLVDEAQVTWSTILDPLVLFAGRPFALHEEYIAGWFSLFPAAHLTPYRGIDEVPPSWFVRLEYGRRTISKYWDFDPNRTIRYRTDTEYEEHFRAVFTEAVQRRLRSDSPILAELSGGMDSSSIVCVADTVIARGASDTPRLDTISYYNDSEPNWNERPYFTRVEERRGRAGCHIDVSSRKSFDSEPENQSFAAIPGFSGCSTEASCRFAACIASQGNRVVLSGIGGDEVTGGVPTPTPELMDLLARARFRALAGQLKVWALNKRKPWFYLLFEAARGFLPPTLVGIPKRMQPAVWLHPRFVKSQRDALSGYASRVRLFGPLPSFQDNIATLEVLRRQLSASPLTSRPPYEKRYPFLDRTLLEFLFATPREQLLRPGQRRSLMRRALAGIVPSELLNRKRKAFLVRSPMVAITEEWSKLLNVNEEMISATLGIIDTNALNRAVREAHQGRQLAVVTLMRTMTLESWLRGLSVQRTEGPRLDSSGVPPRKKQMSKSWLAQHWDISPNQDSPKTLQGERG